MIAFNDITKYDRAWAEVEFCKFRKNLEGTTLIVVYTVYPR